MSLAEHRAGQGETAISFPDTAPTVMRSKTTGTKRGRGWGPRARAYFTRHRRGASSAFHH